MYQKYLPDGPKPKTEVTLKFLENQSLTIRDHLYPLDDLYCYVARPTRRDVFEWELISPFGA